MDALKGRLATLEAETKANDPKALRAEIMRLRTDLATASAIVPPISEDERQRAFQEGLYQARNDALAELGTVRADAIAAVDKAIGALQRKMNERPALLPKPVNIIVPARRVIDAKTGADITGQPHVRHIAPQRTPRPNADSPQLSIPKGERACLTAAAQHPNGVTRQQLTVLTGYKRSSRDAYIQRLRERGYVDTAGDRIQPTSEGVAALGHDFEPLPTGAALREHVLRTLPEGERKVLEVLINAWPNEVPRDDIDAATGYKRSSRDAYLQRLSARELVAAAGGRASAAPTLFD